MVAHLLTVDEGGDRTLGEMKAAVRSELAQRGGIQRDEETPQRQVCGQGRRAGAPGEAVPATKP